jgi:hypothetical protein
LFLLLAARSIPKRLFFIRWTRPYPLQEFLLPTPNSLNWTVPEWMIPVLDDQFDKSMSASITGTSKVYHTKDNLLSKASNDPSITIVEGSVNYNVSDLYSKWIQNFHPNTETSDNYVVFFHDLFRLLFQPSPPIQTLLQQHLHHLQLTPGNYVVAHYRAHYPGEPFVENNFSQAILAETSRNSINCASALLPHTPIYFASDSKDAVGHVQEYAKQLQLSLQKPTNKRSSTRSIVTMDHPERVHLNFAKKKDASGFYSVFVDLLLMGNGQCVSVGAGGFGWFASLLSFNASCTSRHTINGNVQTCDWSE